MKREVKQNMVTKKQLKERVEALENNRLKGALKSLGVKFSDFEKAYKKFEAKKKK